MKASSIVFHIKQLANEHSIVFKASGSKCHTWKLDVYENQMEITSYRITSTVEKLNSFKLKLPEIEKCSLRGCEDGIAYISHSKQGGSETVKHSPNTVLSTRVVAYSLLSGKKKWETAYFDENVCLVVNNFLNEDTFLRGSRYNYYPLVRKSDGRMVTSRFR